MRRNVSYNNAGNIASREAPLRMRWGTLAVKDFAYHTIVPRIPSSKTTKAFDLYFAILSSEDHVHSRLPLET